jgi:hypothetical protein
MAAHVETARFDRLAPRFAAALERVRDRVEPAFVRPDWAERSADLERFLVPVPPPDFLRHPAIRFQMFVDERVVPHELPWVRERLGSPALLAEDPVGAPPTIALPGTDVRTSSNTVHQVHHLLAYEAATGRSVSEAGTVVEWGGGFGSLARLLVRRHAGAPTCVLLDTPVFSALQWLYLSAVLGEERVVLHSAAPVRPEPGRINVVPVGLSGDLEVRADLFVSTWALNESTRAAQRHVLDRDWFGAPALLLAMHETDPFAADVLAAGARAVPVGDFMPVQRYLVR